MIRFVLALLVLAGGFLLFLDGENWLRAVLETSPAISRSRATATPLPPGVVGYATLTTRPDPLRDVTVELTEAELNDRLVREFVGKPVGQTAIGSPTFDALTIGLRNGRAILDGRARIGGTTIPVEASVGFTPDSAGGIRVALSDAKVAGIEIPGPARAQIERQMQLELDRALSIQPMTVRTVEISNGRLRAVGAPRR